MILLRDYKLCFLRKPKCGSTSLEKALREFCTDNDIKNTYYSGKTLLDCNFNYHDWGYVHNNLDSAILCLKKENQNIDNWTFVSTARHPIEMFKSLYFFDINRQTGPLHSKNIYNKFTNPEEMRKTIHYKMWTDRVFWNHHEDVNIKFFKLENIDSLVNFLDTNFGISIKFPQVNINKLRKSNDIDVSSFEKEIYQDFNLYSKLYGIKT